MKDPILFPASPQTFLPWLTLLPAWPTPGYICTTLLTGSLLKGCELKLCLEHLNLQLSALKSNYWDDWLVNVCALCTWFYGKSF